MAPVGTASLKAAQSVGSLWLDTSQESYKYSELQGDIEVDFAIVGGGFTGCSAAVSACAQGASVALLEARTIGHGGSGRNVGLVNAGLWLPPDDVCAILGDSAGERLNATLAAAPGTVFDLIETHQIACEATRNGTLHCAHAASGLRDLENRLSQQQARRAPVQLLDATETARRTGSMVYHGALFDPRAGTVQPLAYVRGLARAAALAGAGVFENSPVSALEHRDGRWHLTAPGGTVRARCLLLATNAYHLGIAGLAPPKAARVSYFQAATDPLPPEAGDILTGGEGCWDTALIMSSFRRDAANRLIFGGMGRPEGLGRSVHLSWLQRAMRRVFPGAARTATVTHLWTGDISMTSDHVPKLVQFGPDACAIMGYSGRGIGPGTVLGAAAASALLTSTTADMPLVSLSEYQESFVTARSEYFEAGARIMHLAMDRTKFA